MRSSRHTKSLTYMLHGQGQTYCLVMIDTGWWSMCSQFIVLNVPYVSRSICMVKISSQNCCFECALSMCSLSVWRQGPTIIQKGHDWRWSPIMEVGRPQRYQAIVDYFAMELAQCQKEVIFLRRLTWMPPWWPFVQCFPFSYLLILFSRKKQSFVCGHLDHFVLLSNLQAVLFLPGYN